MFVCRFLTAGYTFTEGVHIYETYLLIIEAV